MSSDPLSRYSVSGSNIERILSRYRPIAPKPTNTCSSTVSASASTSTEQLLQPVPQRRTNGSGKRKRTAEPAATDMCQSSKISQRSSGVGGGGGHRSISNPLNHGVFCVNNNNNNNCPAISSPDLFADSLIQTCTKLDSGGSTLEKPSLRSSWSSSYNNNSNHNNNTSSSNNHNNNNNYSIKNSNSNSNSNSSNNNNNNNNNSSSVGKGFFQMIRGITCLPSTADVHALLTPRISTNTVINEELLSVSSKSSDLNNNNNNNSNSPVTLSLFPETPLPNQSKKPAKTVENRKPFSCSPTLIEKPHDVEKAYGSSSDPILLVDDKGVVVWTNTAYEKSYKSAMDRPISSSSVYIDPLGIPTQLTEFRLASSGKVFTLWGFLKRLVGIGEASGQILPISSCNNGGAREIPGFSLSLERITEIKSSSSLSSSALLRGSGLQEAQLHASSLSCPAFITEANKQQKLVWNNPAFEKIVDHVSRHAGDNSKAIKGMGIMSTTNHLVSGVAIPASISSFSGCLNLQWISIDSRREKRTMTIPCDVIRVGGRKREADEAGLFIWKLDVAACLRLCCA